VNIILIEDDPQKAERVSVALRELIADASIELCKSYQSGSRALEATDQVDLVVLDMSLPTFDPIPDQRSGRPRPLGGYDLMRRAKRAGKKCPVIVLTALENFGSGDRTFSFSELKSLCQSDFPDMFRVAIYYSQSTASWREELAAATSEFR
jgi:CheY-like chemotaxis protein